MSSRILLADDYEDSARSIARLLELAGYHVFVALDGITAFNEALLVRPHIALIDLSLARLDGYALARCFRAEPRLRDTILVCLTGRVLFADEERALIRAFDRVLTKPVSADALVDVLNTLTMTHDAAH